MSRPIRPVPTWLADKDGNPIDADNPIPVTSSGSGGAIAQGAPGADPWPVTGPLTDAQLRSSAVPVTISTTPETLAASLATATAAGTVAAGAKMVSVKNTGAAAATVAGGSLPAGETVTWVAPDGAVLGAVAYTGSASAALLIAVLR